MAAAATVTVLRQRPPEDTVLDLDEVNTGPAEPGEPAEPADRAGPGASETGEPTAEILYIGSEIKVWIARANEAEGKFVEYAMESGRRLINLQDRTPHGQWLPLLARLGIEVRTAQRHMDIA